MCCFVTLNVSITHDIWSNMRRGNVFGTMIAHSLGSLAPSPSAPLVVHMMSCNTLRTTSHSRSPLLPRAQIITIIGFVYGDPNRLIYPRDHEVRWGEVDGVTGGVLLLRAVPSQSHSIRPPPSIIKLTASFCITLSPPHPTPPPRFPFYPAQLAEQFLRCAVRQG